MSTLIHERVESARAGENPTVVCRVRSGWVVLGDRQFLRGYSLLLADPVVGSLNDLDSGQRKQFLLDMAAIGDALLEVTDAARINYEILGNKDPALHAHVFPRYACEASDKRHGPVWGYGREERDGRPFDLERDRELMDAIRDCLFVRGVGLATD